jgi:hypothetical protein
MEEQGDIQGQEALEALGIHNVNALWWKARVEHLIG